MASVTGSTTGAYIARLDLDQPHHVGVAKKIDAQIAALAEAFGPVETWFLRGNGGLSAGPSTQVRRP